MSQTNCVNCGRPTKYKLCSNCFIELRAREKARAERMSAEFNKDRKRFLYD
jgi:NMD protein affecting ribosome stability and mRNA decay